MKETIENKNSRGQYHGYQELWVTKGIWYRGTYRNGLLIGYHEENWFNDRCIGDIDTEVNFYIR